MDSKLEYEELENFQKQDKDISVIYKFKQEFDHKPEKTQIVQFSMNGRTFWRVWESIYFKNDIRYRTGTSGPRLILPESLRAEVFKQLHSNRIAGHLGRDRTIHSVKRRFYWPNLSSDVQRWVQSCNTCTRRKPGPGCGKSSLQQDLSFQVLDRIALDIMGPLPETSDGNLCILVVSEYFTKFTEAYALRDHTALTVADKLVTEFICRYGVPKVIHSDQGPEFESTLFRRRCEILGIEKIRTVHNPKSDGLVERHNRTIQAMLARVVNECRNDWDDHLPFVMRAYRASRHDSTKCSPNLLMFGREVTFPVDLMFCDCPDQQNYVCPSEYVEW